MILNQFFKYLDKYFLAEAATILLAVGLMFGSFAERQANASRVDTVPSLMINNLGQYKGQFLTVFYILGNRPFLATSQSQVDVDKVKSQKTLLIDKDQITMPAQQIEKENIRGSYNFVIIVVSTQDKPVWKNADGSIPPGQLSSLVNDGRQFSVINVISKQEIEASSISENQFFNWTLK